ncbi:MAG: YdcF family protein [Gammaproteobacteria bacterium]|nr:YdcF family protein [Gammaproteobacteria bacterium]
MADELPKADVIVVPGHKLDAPGCASATMIHRVKSSVDLFQKGLAPSLLLCGGSNKFSPSEAELMASIARDHGVPEKNIFKETKSRTTLENALNSQPIIVQHAWKSAYLVSNESHLSRCAMVFALTGLTHLHLIPAKGGEDHFRAREMIAHAYYRCKLWRHRADFNEHRASVVSHSLRKHHSA